MLVRFVPCFVAQWEAAFGEDAKYPVGTLPYWALSTFAPGEREGGRISLYEVDEEVSFSDVAAALAFLKQSTPRWFFVGASRAALEARGIELLTTDGATHHPSVNKRHRDVEVPDRTALTSIASVFLKGEPLNVEKREVETRLNAQARSDIIDWGGTAKGANENAWRYVREFTKKGAVELRGTPSA